MDRLNSVSSLAYVAISQDAVKLTFVPSDFLPEHFMVNFSCR